MDSHRPLPLVATDLSDPGSVPAPAPAPSRKCGTCNLCCLVFEVKAPTVVKDSTTWCPNCSIGQKEGCKVYGTADRPEECGSFYCLWTRGVGPDEGRPDRSRAVLRVTPDGKALQIHPHPMMPDAWKNTWIRPFVERALRAKVEVFVIVGKSRTALLPLNGRVYVEQIGDSP